MTSNIEQTETAPATAPAEKKRTKKARGGARGANVAPKKAKSGKKASPAKKAPKSRTKAKRRRKAAKEGPRRQQDRQDPRPAETAGRSNRQGTDESHRLAAAFGSRVSLRHRRKENGADRHLHEGRRRRAQLFRQSLIASCSRSIAPLGSGPAALLVLEDS